MRLFRYNFNANLKNKILKCVPIAIHTTVTLAIKDWSMITAQLNNNLHIPELANLAIDLITKNRISAKYHHMAFQSILLHLPLLLVE